MIGSVYRALRHVIGRRGVTTRRHRTVGGLVLLTLGVLLAPSATIAEQLGNVAWVGFLILAAPDRSASPAFQAFAQRLRELSYVEGQNLVIEFRTAQGNSERLPDLATELVRLPIDVIVASGPEATLRATRHATSTIPTIMIAVNYDPMARGYIDGIARPGGNTTGLFFMQLALTAKRLELLKKALPQIAALALKHRLPAMHQARGWVMAGGLMSYGPSDPDMFRRAADYVDRILKGTKPAHLPLEQPTKFELVINLKTAKALGITIPSTLLFQADEVLQ